jgi:hypothetical protein
MNAKLPTLSFANDAIDMALSANFLFYYSNNLGMQNGSIKITYNYCTKMSEKHM